MIDDSTSNFNPEKSKRQTQTSDIDFTVPLSLEECIRRFDHSDENAVMQFIVHTEPVNKNLQKISLVATVGKSQELDRTALASIRIKVNGKLQRKDANSTRITGTAEFVNEMDQAISSRLGIVSFCFILMLCLTIFDTFLNFPRISGSIVLFILTLIIYGLILLIMDARNTAIKTQQLVDDLQRYLLFDDQNARTTFDVNSAGNND